MWNCARLTSVAIAVALGGGLIGCQGGSATPALRYEKQDWQFAGRPGWRITTDHYRIFTTIDDERLVETFPVFIESAFAFYQQLIPRGGAETKPMPLYLFASPSEWRRFTEMSFPEQSARQLTHIRNGGYTFRGIAAMQYVSHATTFPLLAHEGFHQYLYHHVGRRAPIWLNEGFATAAEGFRWQGTDRVTFDPYHNPKRRNQLAQAIVRNRLIPLPTLLEAHPSDFLRRPGVVDTYYAQAWMLVLFLRDGADGRYRADLERLSAALTEGNLERYARAAFIRSAAGAEYNFDAYLFRSFFGADLVEIERQYVAFMRANVLSEAP